jgi:nucleoid DNA-binding protein
MSFTKERLIHSIHGRFEIRKNRSADLIESLWGIIKKTLRNGEDVVNEGERES